VSAATAGSYTGGGLEVAKSTGVKIVGVKARYRVIGLHLSANTDATAIGNDLRGSGRCTSSSSALMLSSCKVGTLPRGVLVKDNLFAVSNCQVHVSGCDNLVVRGAPASGADIVLERSKGFGTGNSWALAVHGGKNIDIAGLDVGATLTKPVGAGIRLDQVQGAVVKAIRASRRNQGVYASGSTGVVVSCSTFDKCAAGVHTSLPASVKDCRFAGNTYAVQYTGTAPMSAKGNYWGAADGSGSAGGSGDKVSGKVDASGPLSKPPACAPAP